MYHKICFDRLPTVRHAHSYETEHYCFHFPACRDFLEISYLEKGDVIREVKGEGKTSFAVPCLAIRRGEQDCLMYSEAPVHRHITVGLAWPFESYPVTSSDIVDCFRKPALDLRRLFCDRNRLYSYRKRRERCGSSAAKNRPRPCNAGQQPNAAVCRPGG